MNAIARNVPRDPLVQGAFLVDGDYMAPTISEGSLVFYGERNVWSGEGLYVLPTPGYPDRLTVRRLHPILSKSGGVQILYDNPVYHPGNHDMPRERLFEHGFYPVMGWAHAYREAFGLFLRDRFTGGHIHI